MSERNDTEQRRCCREQWRALLGPDRAVEEGDRLDAVSRSTTPSSKRPAMVLQPEHRDEVAAILRLAREHGHPVYPYSCGRNWGYGDATATVDDAALLDLRRMNRIVEINTELGYAVLEPGVTQQQLYEAVRDRAPGYWIDATGAGRDASIVGNALSRGFGHTPYADHVRSACALEVVLPDGTILHTGLGHFGNAQAANVFPYGTGPGLDGLFFQSNLGVVTRMTLMLYPAPEAFLFFYIPVADEAGLPDLVDALRPLRLGGVLNSAVHLGNDLRVISAHQGYPWDRAEGVTPLPPALRARLREETGVAPWNASGSLAGTGGQVRAAARRLRRALRPLGLRPVFLNDRRLAWAGRAVDLLRRFGLAELQARQLEALRPNYGLLKGIPTDSPLEAIRWRLRTPSNAPVPTDPRDLDCGLLWLSPLLPMTGAHTRAVLRILEETLHRHGFDVLVTFTSLNERTLTAVVSISFDRSWPGDGEAAQAAYDEGLAALTAAGYYPYRTPIPGQSRLVGADDPFWKLARGIKESVDPGDVLASGHYIPALAREPAPEEAGPAR